MIATHRMIDIKKIIFYGPSNTMERFVAFHYQLFFFNKLYLIFITKMIID